MTITLLKADDGPEWPIPHHRYRIEDEKGWCEFGIWDNGKWIGSYGGSTWLFSWPDLFEYVNPNTYYAGYRIKDRSVLPRGEA